jgi:hypothetical protein
MPNRHIPVGGIAYPADFLVDPTDPAEMLKLQSQEMIWTAAGTLKPKSNTASPKALADSSELVYGGTRLGQHMHAIGRWSLVDMLEHTKFIFIVVKLESQGYTWSQLADLEQHYRQGMHSHKYSSLADESTIATQVVLLCRPKARTKQTARATSPNRAKKAKKAKTDTNNGTDNTKKKTKSNTGKKLVFKFDKGTCGTYICKNYNNNVPCRPCPPGTKKSKGPCLSGFLHQCAMCRQSHRACDHH